MDFWLKEIITKKEKQIIEQGGSLEDIKSRLDRKRINPIPGLTPFVPVKPRPPIQEDRWWDIPGVTQGTLNLMCVPGEEWDFDIGGCYANV